MGKNKQGTKGKGKNSGEMDKAAAARVQSSAAKNPDGDTAMSDFDRRAQSTADRNEMRSRSGG